MSKIFRSTSNKSVRTKISIHRVPLLLMSVLMMCSLPAYAQYTYQVVLPPGAEGAQAFGINNAGTVTGGSDISFSFTYDMKSGEYTTISTDFSVLDISNSGVMVGDVDGVCAIRDKLGNVTMFSPPSMTGDSICRARGVNSKGQVSGFEVDEFGVWLGFIHDPQHGTYEEFLPSERTIAHAINAQGQNVGTVNLDPDEAYPGSAAGRYGYRRETDGSIKYFQISQSYPGQSNARGISENGLITGFYLDPVTFEYRSYVTTLSDDNEFEDISLTDDQVLYQKPCNPDIPPPPDEDYELFSDMFSSHIRNDGVVVGSCFDTYFNETTGDFVDYAVGFIATPE